MAWSTPTTRSTNFLVTAAVWNSDVVENPIALRTGALAMTNQSAGHFVMAQTATQLTADSDEQAMLFMEAFG